MSDINDIQTMANRYMTDFVEDDLSTMIKKTGAKIDKKDGTETIFSEDTKKIVVPKMMSKLQASYNLLSQFKEEETYRTYNRTYENFFVNDFMVALQNLIPKYFGMLHVSQANTEGKKASQDYIQIPIKYVDDVLITSQGYLGSIVAPCWEDAIIDISLNSIAVRAKLKYQSEVDSFFLDIQKYILNSSVVKGTSVTVERIPGTGYLKTTPINPKRNSKIVLSDDVERIIANLIVPSLADKSKTSLLFTGDYGTGKTETAIRVGVSAQTLFGRTFFYLHNATMFGNLIPFLKNYQPAVVFCEDVDQISGGDRDTQMNDLLNQLDGNELKNVDCTFIFTTNNHNKIHQAMRRPGRIDQVVHFDYCDVKMIAEIFKMYADGFEGSDTVDYVQAAQACPPNLQGAVVAEISRRAQKYAEKLHKGVISTNVFLDAIASMKHHINFMREEQEKDNSVENLLGHVLYKTMKKALPEAFDYNESDYSKV